MQLVALKKLRYPRGPDGKEYGVGDEFTALSERDAKALTLVRAARAKDVPATAAPPAATPAATASGLFENRAATAEASATADETPPKRTYKRRDMRAEE